MNKYFKIGVVIIVILVALFAWKKPKDNTPVKSERTLITSVKYMCDNDKSISVAYYEDKELTQPIEGEPAVPSNSVDISLDEGPLMLLTQTVSASGARYANIDESLVFWNKGDEALIMRNNEMDQTYKNCTAQK